MNEMGNLPQCQHCGTPFQPAAQERFCCVGCAFVHEMITDHHLEKFYDLKGTKSLLPVGNEVLLAPDPTWARAAQEAAETATEQDFVEASFDVQGVSCVGCVWLIEATFQGSPGSVRCFVDPTRGQATLTRCKGSFDLAGFVSKVSDFGYKFAPAHRLEPPSGASGLRLGLCGALAMNAMAFTLPRYVGMAATFALADCFELIAAFSATVSLLVGGSYFVKRAWAALRMGQLHLDVPIALGLLAAWAGSLIGWLLRTPGLLYFDFVAVFIFLMLLGRRMQEVSVARNRHRLLRHDLSLQEVEIDTTDGWERHPVSALQISQQFRVSPGSVVPVAAQLQSSQATFSLDWITGEAEPIHYSAGATIPAGAVNLSAQPLSLTASEAWTDSLLARLVEAGSTPLRDNPAARWLDRTLRWYLGIIMVTGVLGALIWLFRGAAWPQALQIFVSVLVVSCPCALGVAVPLAHDLAVARLRGAGLFVRTSDLWGRLLRVKKIVFDKTGTLTLDTPKLQDAERLAALPAEAAHALALLVSESRHPIACALREALAQRDLFRPTDIVRAEEICGQGLRYADPSGNRWELRRPSDRESIQSEQPAGDSLFTCNGQVLAAFRFSEEVRRDARSEIERLQRLGLSIFLLSGDREAKVLAMAAAIGVPSSQACARQTPSDKGEWMQAHGREALFIGDGANDTLAAQVALCSGTLAVERTLLAEQSDFYFLSRSLRPVRLLFQIATLRRIAVRRAFAFALTYNLVVLILALLGRMNPLLAAILMPLSSLFTILIVSVTLGSKVGQTEPGGNTQAPQLGLEPLVPVIATGSL